MGSPQRGQASLPCFVLLVLLVAAIKILAVKAGTSIDPLLSQPALYVPVTSALFC
jgi:hypothetical protein